jgi:hypothetical protein
MNRVARTRESPALDRRGRLLTLDGHQPEIGGGLRRAVKASGLQNRQQHRGNGRAYSGDGLKQPPVALQVGMRTDVGFDGQVDEFEFLLQVREHPLQGFGHESIALSCQEFFAAVAFALKVGLKRLSAADQDLQLPVTRRGRLPKPEFRRGLAIARQDPGIGAVGFGFQAEALGKVFRVGRVDHGHPTTRVE